MLTPPPPRSARICPDRPLVAAIAILLTGIIMVSSYAYSFVAIADAAAWAWTDTPKTPIRWLAPIFIDGAIITYTVSLAIVRWRGEPVRRTMLFLSTFTGISVLVNFAHAGAAQAWTPSRMEFWFAAIIGVSAPLAALFAADEVTKLVFTRITPPGPASPTKTEPAPTTSTTPPKPPQPHVTIWPAPTHATTPHTTAPPPTTTTRTFTLTNGHLTPTP